MPKIMKLEEIEQALAAIERQRPPTPRPEHADRAAELVSFSMLGGPDFILLRLVDAKDEVQDVRIPQAVAVVLFGDLAKVIHPIDWVDSPPAANADPAPLN